MKKYIRAAAIFAAAALLLSSCKSIESRADIKGEQGVAITTRATALPAMAAPKTEAQTEVSAESPTEEELPEKEEENEAKEENETKNENARAVISFVGDVTQSDVFGEATSYRYPEYPFEDVSGIFQSADLSFANLETCVSERGESEKKEGYGFRTDPDFLSVFTLAGLDIVSTANNHVRDFGMEALDDTFTNLENAGLKYVGAGRNSSEAEKLELFELKGITVGFTACNMINMNPNWYAEEDRAGIACVDSDNSGEYLEKIADYDKLCDVLFVSVHWGVEYYNEVTEEQQAFAHSLCDSGADIILGHHPHVLEPIESYKDSVIFYSLGNFLFYKMNDEAGETAVFTVEISENGFESGKMSPAVISYCKAVLLEEESENGAAIIGRVAKLSEKYGIEIDERGEISRKYE